MKVKEWLKSNYKSLIIYGIIYIVLLLFFVFPLPYSVDLPGGVENENVFLTVENIYPDKTIKGSFNSSYVTVIDKPSPFQYLLAKLNKKAEIFKMSKVTYSEPIAELLEKDKLYKASSIYNALIASYNAAGKHLKYEEKGVVIIDRIENTPAYQALKVGDIIIKINDKQVKNLEEAWNILTTIPCEEPFTLTVLRNKNEEVINIQKVRLETDNSCILGLYQGYLYTNYEIDYENSNPRIINIDWSGYGPSAGLIQALSIYNMLTPIDITFGLKIAGTGTIDVNGNVGPIGGIKQKVYGACKAKVDVFFTPPVHYEEAVEARDLMKSKMIIVPVETLEEAINYLMENYGQN